MEIQLFSIDKAPRTLPVWESIISDLGRPAPARVAKVLGVGRSTVYRWHAAGGGPRIACLALFWLTRWGHSEVVTQATNDAILAVQLARTLEAENKALRLALQPPADRAGSSHPGLNGRGPRLDPSTAALAAPASHGSAATADRCRTWPASTILTARRQLSWPVEAGVLR